MKYIVYGIVSAAIMFLSVLMFLTVEGRTDHEKTLEEAVSLALDQTMQEQRWRSTAWIAKMVCCPWG